MKKINMFYSVLLVLVIVFSLNATSVNTVSKNSEYQIKDTIIQIDTVKQQKPTIIKSQNSKMDSLLMKKTK